MFRSHLNSVDDLKPMMDLGIKVVFGSLVISMGNLLDAKPGALWRGFPYKKEINIRTRLDTFPPSKIYGRIPEVDEQKITLLHELDHLFHETCGTKDGYMSSDNPIEIEIDRHCYNILIDMPHLLEQIVYELSTRNNCHIVYESLEETPFHRFHLQLIDKFIKNISVNSLIFGDQSTIRLLQIANQR